MHRLLILLLACSLSACALDNLSEGAGQFRTDVEIGLHPADQVPYIKSVEIIDGKESASVNAELAWDENGRPVVKLERKDVKAFEGQATAGKAITAVTKTLADMGIALTPAIIDGILKGFGIP